MGIELYEKQLIERVLSGSNEAFTELIKKYERLVFHIVFRLIPIKSDFEDLGQDVFIKVYSKLNTFKGDAKLSTWIARIAYNTCLNYLEKKKIQLLDDTIIHSSDEDDESSLIDTFENNSPLPDDILERDISSAIIHEEIFKLPVKYRAIITLYHLESMSYKEIAEITRMPEGSVKSYLFRARNMLKENLIKKYSMEDICL